eukprot:2196302-Amphidinium_carterae.1
MVATEQRPDLPKLPHHVHPHPQDKPKFPLHLTQRSSGMSKPCGARDSPARARASPFAPQAEPNASPPKQRELHSLPKHLTT